MMKFRSPLVALFALLLSLFSLQTAIAQEEEKAPSIKVVLVDAVNEGKSDTFQIELWEEELLRIINESGYQGLTELPGAEGPPPKSANELRMVAEMRDADYTLVPIFMSATEQNARIRFRVGHPTQMRVDEFEYFISKAHAAAQISTILRFMLRDEGIGDRLKLVGELNKITAPSPKKEATETKTDSTQPSASPPIDKDEELDLSGWGASATFVFRPLIRSRASGSVFATQARITYDADSLLKGLELRAGFDLNLGSTRVMSVNAGGRYFIKPFDFPLELGGEAELGLAQFLSGNRVPSFAFSVSPVARWKLSEHFSIEAKLLEVNVWSASSGVITLGFGAGAQYKF